MSAQLVSFPAPSRPLPPPPARRRYRLDDIARLLALDTRDRRCQIHRLRQLARVDGLPLPLTPRIWNGQRLRDARAICAESQWDAAQVDAWLHRPNPGAPALAAPPPLPAALRDEMRARAQHLAGVAA